MIISLLKFFISLDGIYGGLDTIKSYFPTLYLFKSKTSNLARLNKLRFLEFIFAVSIAFDKISIPVPLEKFSSFKIESSIQPEPVPISKIFILLFLKKFITV